MAPRQTSKRSWFWLTKARTRGCCEIPVKGRSRLPTINIDDPYFTIEPPRWPASYARTVSLGTQSRPGTFLTMRLTSAFFAQLVEGTGQDAPAILAAGGHTEPLHSFDIPARLKVHLHVTQKTYSSPNILAALPVPSRFSRTNT